MVAKVITKSTEAPIPIAVSILVLTPKKGQMPRNCASTMLLTRMADIKMITYSMALRL
jgi:hypothetical protein